MDDGTTSLTDLRLKLEAQENERVYVKALLKRTGATWTLRHADALVGVEPSNWAETTWQYEQVVLVACVIPASLAARLCSDGGTSTVTLGTLEVAVPAAQQSVQWRHEPGFAPHERAPVSQPTMSFTVPFANQNTSTEQPSILVAESCPSFLDLNAAWRAFADADYALGTSLSTPNQLVHIRLADKRGWIGPIHISPTELTVMVFGDAVDGSELELYGLTDRAMRKLDGPGTVTVPLDSGLPDDAWLWLKRGTDWLDYRSLSPRLGWTRDLSQAGVTIDDPIDPQATIDALLAAGEGPRVEFKEYLPSSKDPQSRRTLKTVAAFANGDGGAIVFGVNRDEVTVVGLAGDPVKLRDELTKLIRSTVTPMPHVHASHYQVAGKTILLLEVPAGPTPPYGISDGASRDKPEYFVRRGASTYFAQPSELREAVVSMPNTSQLTEGRS